jgi:Domain of unknown function (DUF4193)
MAKKKSPATEVVDKDVELDDDPDEALDGDLDEDLDEELESLDGDLDEDLDDEGLGDDGELDEDADEADEVEPTAGKPLEEDEDDVPDADDVEASLDVILKERLVVEDEPEDEESIEVDDRGEGTERVLPKQADEFVCQGCFVLKNASQLANKKKGLCRDCA